MAERRVPDFLETERTQGTDVARARFEMVQSQLAARPSSKISDRIKAKIFPRAISIGADPSGEGRPLLSFSGQGSQDARDQMTVAEMAFLDALLQRRRDVRLGRVRVTNGTQPAQAQPQGGQGQARSQGQGQAAQQQGSRR